MDLPVEIIFAVLEHVYYRDSESGRSNLILSREPDFATLSVCSSISSAWRAPSQALLFNHITASVVPHLMNTAKRNSRERWEALMEHIRILDILLNPYGPHQTQFGLEEFAELLRYCPNLYELSIRSIGVISLQPILSDLYRSTPPIYPSRLHALRVLQCSVQSSILYELLDFFPTIKFLAIGLEIVAPPPAVVSKVQLYELSMYRTLSYEISSWLLSGSQNSLRVVELRDLPSIQVSNLLQDYGHRLHSVRTMRYNINTANFLQSCTNLRELVLLGLPSVPTLAVQKLPYTLEHFSLVHGHSGPSVDISGVLMLVRTSSNLKLLTCDEKLKSDSQYESLRDVCVKRGVEIKMSKYGCWPNEEPVDASSFPRERTTLNFHCMNQN